MIRARLPASVFLAAAAAVAGLVASAWAGPALESETFSIPRSAATGGGSGEAFSATYRLIPVLGEEAATSTAPASGSHRLGTGLAHIAHFPGKVTGLAERGDASVSSATLVWTSPGYDGAEGALQPGTTYFLRVASFTVPDTFSDHRLANVSFATAGMSPGELASAGATGLLPNTTYWARVWTLDAAGNLSYASDISTFVTLALPPALQPESFVNVFFTSVTAQWVARPSSPPDAASMTAAGYIVEASSTDFGALSPGGVITASATSNVSLSTLTVSSPGLVVDRRYYFRVGALNWAGVANWTALGSTDTKFQVNEPIPADPPYTNLSSGALTANWDRNGNPGNAFYHAEVSTAADFTGVVTATDTFNLFYSTGGLEVNATYYFRVYATTRSQASGFASMGSTMTWSFAPAPAAVAFPDVHASSLTVRWLHGGNPAGQSTYTLVASTSPVYPNEDDGRVVLASTRPGGADPMATLTGLAFNTTYYLFSAAHNDVGAQGEWTLVGSTPTRPSPPAFAGLEEVAFSSAVVSWGTNANPLGVTTYTVVLSTAASYPPGGEWDVLVSTVPDAALVVLALEGLRLNVTYYLSVEAVGHAHRAFTAATSTATQAAVPATSPDAPLYDPVSVTGLSVNWSSGAAVPGFNAPPNATTYYAQVADNPGFSPVQFSSVTFNLSAAFSGLGVNTTYYARASAYSHHHGTWTAYADFGSTATLAAAPAAAAAPFLDVFFSSAIVAWSRNGNPIGVTTYTVVLTSGSSYPNALPDNVVLDTAPAGATPVATMSGLSSNTTYYLFVRALNHKGAATAYAAFGSTLTLFSPKTWVGGCGNSNWYNAACWSPSGVPQQTDAVTIAQAVSVVVDASSPAVSFSSLTLGVPGGGAAANLTLATVTARAGSVLLHMDAGLTQATTSQLVFDGDFTMLSGSSLTHAAESAVSVSSVNLRVTGTFDLQAGATVNVVGRGFRGGAVDNAGVGPGGGGTDTAANEGGGGGGYGGSGGSGVGAPGGSGGTTYPSQTVPVLMGSGGGGGGITGTGGAGGGIVVLDVGTMILDGVILSSGGAGRSVPPATTAAGGGGGSGGGVRIAAVAFSGAGTIDVSGGPGGSDDVGPAGGGGGGRAAVTITGSGVTCALTLVTSGGASGGGGAGAGSAGTFYSADLLNAPQNFAGTPLSATSIQWTWSLTNGATDYQLFSSTGGPMSPPLGAADNYTTTGLAVNTTASFYVQARACGVNLADSSPVLVATLAQAPAAAGASFAAVGRSSMSVLWAANGNPVDVTTYTVVLTTESSYPNAAGGNVSLSTFPAGASLAATLQALDPNTTYYAFVAARNHAGLETGYAGLGSTSTLADPPLALPVTFLSIQPATVTVAWAALPAAPPEASSRTCAGYLLEISSTDFGALSPGGVINSSFTPAVSLSTLTVAFPDPAESTNYYRVASLNWNGARSYLQLGKLNFQIIRSTGLVTIGAIDMTVALSSVATTSMVVTNVGDLPATYVIDADTNTPGSPWTLGVAPGDDVAALQGLWNTGPPGPPHAAFSTPITNDSRASGGAGGAYAGDQNAFQVPVGQSRTLWFRLRIPSSTSSNAPEQIRVSVTPVYP